MRVLVCNLADAASVNIRDHLLATHDWQDAGMFRGHPMHQRGYDLLVHVERDVIRDLRLDADIADMGWPVHAVWFLSRHVAKSGQPSLTVHPIGNHHAAEFGGAPEHVSPAAPRDMGALLRRLRHHRDAAGLPHEVTFEATHHGPLMTVPSLFVEIGSDDTWYSDEESGRVLAAAVTDVLDGEGGCDGPIVVGVGGGHYVPRLTDLALAGEMDVGHMVPAYAVDPEEDGGVLERAVAGTPGATGVYVHKKGLKGPQRQAVQAWMDARGLAPQPTP